MRQFDAPKKSRKKTGGNHKSDGLAGVLDELEDELEDDSESDEGDGDEECEEVEEIDGIEELLGGCEGMTPDEIQELDDSVKPVRLVLTKVSQLLHKYDLTQ